MTEPPRATRPEALEHAPEAAPKNAAENATAENAGADDARADDARADDARADDARADDAAHGQWLHPTSLLFEFAAGIRNQLIPAILALFSATTGSWIGGLIALLYFVGSMAAVVLRYLRLRYRLAENELIVDEGFIFRVHRTIPVQRIQNIDLVQNPFHRLLGVAEVRVETASGTEPEAILRVLSLAEVESLRARIFARKQNYERSLPGAPTAAAHVHYPSARSLDPIITSAGPPQSALLPDGEQADAGGEEAVLRRTLMKISFRQLALAGIASNRGTVLLFVGLGIISQQAPSAFRTWHIETEDVTRYLPRSTSEIAWLAIAAVGLLAVLLAVKILSIAWYVLKFHDYTLEQSGDDLRVSCGLLTRVSATVRRDRIQVISIHRTLIGRWLKIASIRIESGGGGDDSDDPASTIARRWFMPVIFERQIPAIMEQLSPGLKWDEQAFAWHSISSRAAWRMRRIIVLVAGSLALIASAFGVYPVAISLVLIGAFGWWWAKRRAAAIGYARSDGEILFRSGVFTRKCSLAFIDKVQSVTVGHSPFDRRWQMATLSVDTIASGPAEHSIAIPMLDLAFARVERDIICRSASAAF